MLSDRYQSWDERRNLFLAGSEAQALAFAVEHWIHSAQRAIMQRGKFAVALSGGSTPKAIYQALSVHKTDLPWDKVHLFWSDERAVPPDHADSNYRMAMESGLKHLPIPKDQIHRMDNALDYEEKIHRLLDKGLFDLVMLGMGDDGHTASLFPNSSALHITENLVAANHIAEKGSRITLTFPCINQSREAAIYVLGKSKAPMVSTCLNAPIVSPYPASRIGTPEHKALWIMDAEAGKLLKK